MIAKTRQIADTLNLTTHLPTIHYTNPKKVYVACTNARCATGELYVKVGDKVKIGTVLGKRFGGYFEQNMHSTVSGTVTGIVKKFHRSGKMVEFVEIENDFQDESEDNVNCERSEEEIANFKREDFINIIKENSLIGLGGSSFPTYVKFQTEYKIDTIMVNAVECEPYLTSDHRIILDMPELIFKGLKYTLQAFEAQKAIICIKKKHEDLYEVLTQVSKKFPELNVEIKRVGNYYPQGWEIEMIKSATGIKVKHGELPAKYGIMNFNVSTVVGIYRAIKLNMPVIERNFTLTGDGIKYPSNVRLRVGTPLHDIIELCGGYTDDSDKVAIMGGPMMGANLLLDNAVCTKSCTSVIVLNKKDYVEEPCIRCASCVYSCPCGLQPVLIMQAVKNKDLDGLKKLRVNECIECGMCSYTCTSKIDLTDYMRKGKTLVKGAKK